jgi:hypothetical protein
MMPSQSDELHEPLFQTVGTFSKAFMYGRDFANSETNIQNPNMDVFLEFFNRQN